MSSDADNLRPADRKRTQRERLIAGMIAAAHGVYVVIAPFIGPTAANEFIDAKLRAAEAEAEITRHPPVP